MIIQPRNIIKNPCLFIFPNANTPGEPPGGVHDFRMVKSWKPQESPKNLEEGKRPVLVLTPYSAVPSTRQTLILIRPTILKNSNVLMQLPLLKGIT